MTLYGNGGGAIYAVLALLIVFIFGTPIMFMRAKTGLTGKQYRGASWFKAFYLFYAAIPTGSWGKIYFRWDDLDERFNSRSAKMTAKPRLGGQKKKKAKKPAR